MDLTFFRRTMKKFAFFYFDIFPIILSLATFVNFSQLITQYYDLDGGFSKDALRFMWEIILFAIVLGTLILTMWKDRRTNEGIDLDMSGYTIVMAGLAMFFGIAFQGAYLLEGNSIIKRVGDIVATLGEYMLFLGLAMFWVRLNAIIIKLLIKSLPSKWIKKLMRDKNERP